MIMIIANNYYITHNIIAIQGLANFCTMTASDSGLVVAQCHGHLKYLAPPTTP